ncbi:amino acid ABC transporter substrate-binding protein [Agarivorans sp. OAG1]|jgi:polar amino acid transport system substrate-binding protein|uniref:Lysine-arginine-ornithine-binding periplasmic protein n=2 Tax=Agarivorans TaxID=261825 RepID=R9PSA2_AGAAL|nr:MULTISPECIES: transporter substrate-binding domain-containing protein [Agarivorans]BEU04129.1 amino acid ABC transporter substrate-binding protein [Agarivorans sp. OAG1]MEE1674919.1 transporter substrate-binding domain-containing protein [Agarivorans aestuarii]MPW27662.1 transporter substrate-binding domain-containing protein [Agarivorans sp. B2Z047]UQN44498.1 transporter substrate-binding domain-containing protein [Agarivorans sp. B2Z047]GAD04163.1 lysine-arginine-ornithine-binding peripla
MKRVIQSAIAAVTLLSSAAFAQQTLLQEITESGELRACFDAGYMPFEMKAKNGQFIGFDIDLGKQMARAMGVKYVPVNTAWDGIIPTLLTGKCHLIMGGMTITPQRNMQVNFADPYVVIGQSILLSPKLEGKVTSYRDLNSDQYTVVTKLGTTGEGAIKRYIPKAKVNLFETQSEAVLEVTNGKADAFIYDLPFNAIYAAENQGQLTHLDQPFTFEPLGWAVRQGDPDFLNFLNGYLRQIKGDGTYDRIYDKWFKDDAWLKQVQ